MTFRCAALVAAGLAVVCAQQANAGYHHVIAPMTRVTTSSHPGGGGNWHLCPTPAGIFICAITVGIIVHEIMGPKCARPGLKNGYDAPTLWRPLCKRSLDPKPIAVRG